ncbi:hypothetical protein N9B83_00080 [Schleiferiaceae bacterium]|nr:hypothetical protein [Schleiferiaceae bacterium]
MSKFIIITSIFEPTKAVEEFSKRPGWKLVVVGDRKTPNNWKVPGVVFLSLQDQVKEFPNLELPENIYARKMFGYLYAIRNGATIIAESDDDNVPYEQWGKEDDLFEKKARYSITSSSYTWINIYSYFSEMKPLWPRGFPLDLVLSENSEIDNDSDFESNIGVIQQLADGDPDVDAIYRLTRNEAVIFERGKKGIVLKGSGICPINSQNTFFRQDLFALMYLPVYVNFRVTDILRGYVISVVCNYLGIDIAYDGATVFQERNEHDFLRDFESETPLYSDIKRLPELLEAAILEKHGAAGAPIKDIIRTVYTGLLRYGWIKSKELVTLNQWLGYFE